MNPLPPPEIHRAAPASGLAWLLQSLALLQRQAASLLLIAVLMQLMISLTRIPLLGFLVVLALPALTAGVLEAFAQAARGIRPRISVLMRPLATPGRSGSLFALGAILFLVGVVTAAIVMSGGVQELDPETIIRLEQGDVAALSDLDPVFIQRMLMAFALGMAISGTLSYFAIPLIWFHGLSLWPALAMGTRALMRNWLPFIVMTLCLAGVLIPLSFLGSMVLGLASGDGLMSSVAMVLLLIAILFIQLVLFGAQYCSARQVFRVGEPPPMDDVSVDADEPRNDDDQFVA